jgi:hypothetical protein
MEVAVTDAPFIEGTTEIKGIVYPEDRSDDFPQGAGDPGVDGDRSVSENNAFRIEFIEPQAGPRIIIDGARLAAEQTPTGAEFLDREVETLGHRFAVNVEAAGWVVYPRHHDIVRGKGGFRKRR